MIHFQPGRGLVGKAHMEGNIVRPLNRCRVCGQPDTGLHDRRACVQAWQKRCDDEARKLKGGAGR